MTPESEDAALDIVAELNDWWVQLTDGTSIRFWASGYQLEGESLVFVSLARGVDSARMLELAIVPIESVVRLESGTGVNGEPAKVTQHRYAKERANLIEERDSRNRVD